MFIHHMATVSLISFSYANNMLRVGSLVMSVHDASDFLLEVSLPSNGRRPMTKGLIVLRSEIVKEKSALL